MATTGKNVTECPPYLPNMNPIGYGNPYNPILVFIHGWPDLPCIWDKMVEYFQKDYYCITLELPNFNQNRIQNKWGYDLVTISHAVAYTVKNTILQKSPYSDVTLIIHDWGSLIGLVADKLYPYLFNRVACIDIGDNGKQSEWTKQQQRLFIAYQWYNIFAHFSPSFIGNFMTRKATKWMGAPLVITGNENKIHSGMNYLYWTVWKRILGIGALNKKDLMIRRYPKKPIFFVCGLLSPQKLFTDRWKKYLIETEDCEYLEFDKSGHWVMFDEPDRLNKELQIWLNRTNKNVYKLQAKL